MFLNVTLAAKQKMDNKGEHRVHPHQRRIPSAWSVTVNKYKWIDFIYVEIQLRDRTKRTGLLMSNIWGGK